MSGQILVILDEVFEVQLDVISVSRSTNSNNICLVFRLVASFPGDNCFRLSFE